MNLETLKKLDKKYAQAIANYLLARLEEDTCLKTKLEETAKTLKGCVEYIKTEAKKEAEDGNGMKCAIIEDNQVYNWAVHYFLEDSLNFEPTEKGKKEKPNSKKKVEKIETLFGEEEVIQEKKNKVKEVKPKKNIKEDFKEQLSLFDL